MKKLVATLFTAFQLFGAIERVEAYSLIEYDSIYKEAMVEIAMQDSQRLFLGAELVPYWVQLLFGWLINWQNKAIIRAACDDPLKFKTILVDEHDKVVGFVIYYRSREASLESVKRNLAQQGNDTFTDEELLEKLPGLKLADADCMLYGFIETIAVDTNHRRKGCGRMLLEAAFQACASIMADSISSVHLDVNESNTDARRFYESCGFTLCDIQLLKELRALQYQKELS